MQSGSNNNLPFSEINVTPLVDVMLVLLIIFMLAAPHLDQGVDVDLPEVTIAALPARTDEMVIKVTKDKKIFLDDVDTGLQRLEPVLREALANRAGKDVYIRADKDVPYGYVVQVMAAAKKAGVPGLGLVTEPERIKSP